MRVKILSLAAVAALALPNMAFAQKTQTGTFNGQAWTAESRIIGQTSTATAAAGGNPIYFAAKPKYNGVVALIMDYGGGNRFICSGTLTKDRKSIVTAAHCVSDGSAARPITTTAFFYGGNNPDTIVSRPDLNPGPVGVNISNIFVNSSYTGEVIDQNDIAVLRLGDLAPAFATGFDMYNGGDLTGQDFNVAGYGGRSDAGGSVGANLGTGRLRQGDNRFDFRLGDGDFAGFFAGKPGTDGFFGTATNDYSYLSDFDNGLAANDASCRLAVDGFGIGASGKYCNLGRGALEVGVAGGDSGGPQFINGQLAAVTSYGLSFGTNFGDVGGGLNSSFGEFSGYVPTFIHRNFIDTATSVPEPGTWGMMIFGFGIVGTALRRRKTNLVASIA